MATQNSETIATGVRWSGMWTMNQVSASIAAGTWPGSFLTGLVGWGSGGAGDLGLNNTTDYSTPKQVGSLTTWYTLAPGSSHNIATKTDGTLWAWGNNGSGQLGINTTTNRSSPVQVGALTDWLSNASGNYNSIAVKTTGTLWGWGRNGNGQLGLNDTTYRSSPVQVGAGSTWSTVAGGASFTFAIKNDGTLWSWGSNANGVLGLSLGSYANYRSSPVQVGALTDWLAVGCGLYSAYAIKTDGTFWAWGRNSNGRLGLNVVSDRSSPTQVGALTNWASLPARNWSGGFGSFGAIKTDGTLWTWGTGLAGQLGLNNSTYYSSPKQVGSLTTWLKIISGYRNMMAIKTDGTLWAWGYAANGQLGLGNTTYYSSPVQVGALTTWYTVNSGRLFYAGILT